MSTGTKPQVLLPAYDAQDLRRRMLVCFTIGEMFALATKLQVAQPPSWSNNPQEAARDIVRHFERSGALAFLVEALREAKPLVEWPDPLPLPVPPAPPPAPAPSAPAPTFTPAAAPPPATLPTSAPRGVAGGSTILGVPAPQALEYADTAIEAPGDRATPITDVPAAVLEAATPGASTPPAAPPPATPGFAPSIMRRPGDSPPAPPPPDSHSPPLAGSASPPVATSSPLPAPAPMGPAFSSGALPPPGPTQAMPSSDTLQDPLRATPASRPQAAWPATRSPSGPESKLPNPWILMAAGTGILLVLIGVAFLAGRASSASPAAAGTTGTTDGPPPDHISMAQTAADALGTSLLRVAKACQIDPSTLRGRSLFEVAYTKCGSLPTGGLPEPTGPRPTSFDPLPDPDPAQSPDPDPASPGGKKGTRPAAKSTKPQTVDSPAPPSGGGSSCLGNCTRSHSACKSRCGAEPQQVSQYDAYQSCLGGCLKAHNQCKMGCN